MLEADKPSWHLMEFMIASAEDAMDEENNDWSGIDELYENRKHSYWLGDYSIGNEK